ncbi:hypothetical protein D3C75_1083950 [compost metagenome]
MVGIPEAAPLLRPLRSMMRCRSAVWRRSAVRAVTPVVPAAAEAISRLALPYTVTADVPLAVRINRQPILRDILVAARDANAYQSDYTKK